MSKKMGAQKTPGSNSRRQQILQAARETFKEKGFHAATTSEIARRAGVAEGTIFNHFRTKKELLFALLEPFNAEEVGAFFCQVAGETDRDKLHLLLENHLLFVKENLSLFRILLYESQFHPELREQFIKKVVMKTLEPVEKHLSRGIEEGKYRGVDPHIAARAFFGMLTVFVAWSEILQADDFMQFDERAVIEDVISIFMRGIKKDHI